jgi:N-acetylglucosaminylphosphatidylinositol deacetylase
LVAGLALGIALLVPFFYLLQRSLALQPRPLPHVQETADGGKINVLLVVAHPDDESMFFGPTLLSLAELGVYNIRALCFSTGNADGLGSVRKSEMVTACSVLKIPAENVDVVDHPALQDGFSSLWDQSLIVNLLKQTVADHNVQVVLTFDSHGISGHPNHRAVHNGVQAFLLEEGKLANNKRSSVQGWELVSTNMLRKYSGPLELCAPVLKRIFSDEEKLHHLVNPSPRTSIVAMSRHKSQWVWYRRLFVLFSRYTYVNTLKKMPG